MDIEKGKTPIGQDYIKFKTQYNETCTLVAFEEALRCAIREDEDISMRAPFTHFTREEVKALLPYLQAFVDSGTFDLATESSQGDMISVERVRHVIRRHSDHYEREEDEEGFNTCEAILRDLGLPESKYGTLQEIKQDINTPQDVRDLASELSTMQEAGVAMASNIVDQGKRIQALVETTARMNVRNYRYEQLLKEWKKYGQSPFDSKSPDELVYLTEQLIEGRAKSVEGVNEIEKARIESAYCLRQLDKQVDRIADLEELVISWQGFAEDLVDEYGDTYDEDRKKLVDRTAKLLGEEDE